MSDLSDYEYEYEDEDAEEAMETTSSVHHSSVAVVSLENSLNGLVKFDVYFFTTIDVMYH